MQKIIAAPKLRLLFDRRKQSGRNKQGCVDIEVYYERKRVYIATTVCVLPSQWRNDCVIKHEQAIEMNQLIQEEIKEVRRRIARATSEADGFSIEKIKGIAFSRRFFEERKQKELEEKEAKLSFMDWLEERIKIHPCRESTRKQHLVMKRKIEEFGVFESFEDLTTANIKKLDTYLHSQKKSDDERHRQSTVHGYHKRFKTYVREALELGLIDKNPYAALHISRGKTEGLKYLTSEERDSIEALNLKGTDELVRDMFIFSCYTGLAYSDVIKLEKKDVKVSSGIHFIEDKRQKTSSKYKITLLPKAIAVLEKYDYNLNRLSDQKCNIHLKTIAAKAGIDKNLTFHMGRHTFATWALKSGVPIEQVSKMLAHADITTTQVYAKVLQEEVDKGFALLRSKCEKK